MIFEDETMIENETTTYTFLEHNSYLENVKQIDFDKHLQHSSPVCKRGS